MLYAIGLFIVVWGIMFAYRGRDKLKVNDTGKSKVGAIMDDFSVGPSTDTVEVGSFGGDTGGDGGDGGD